MITVTYTKNILGEVSLTVNTDTVPGCFRVSFGLVGESEMNAFDLAGRLEVSENEIVAFLREQARLAVSREFDVPQNNLAVSNNPVVYSVYVSTR